MFEAYKSLSESNKLIALDIARQTKYSIEEISDMYFYFGRNFRTLIVHLENIGMDIRYCQSFSSLYSPIK